MRIRPWSKYTEQLCNLGKDSWSVDRLIQLSSELPVQDIPLDYINISSVYPALHSTQEYLGHLQAVQQADLAYPIILDEEGCIMDGRHRITKAILLGHTTIKCVRFDKNPEPCTTKES